MQQYLVTMRQLPAANTPIDVMVLAAGRYHAALIEACHSSEVLRFHVINADTRCHDAGIGKFPAGAPCDALFLHAAATAAPAQQFAQDQHRHHYLLWQMGKWLYGAGMAVLAAGLLVALVQLFDVYNLREHILSDKTQFDSISAEYARVTATFPPTPTSTENLKTTIREYRTLQAQTASPAYLFAEISKALAGFAEVEIERIDWRVGKPPPEGGAKGAASRAAAPVPAAAAAPGAAPAADLGYELATVSARVVGTRSADMRSITAMANQFIAILKKVPRLEIIEADMPFDITAEDTLKGDIGAERAIAEDARFAVTIGRRLGG
jgi:hypothetical protein